MLSDELLRKVRRIEIFTRKMVDDVMSGQYRTHFKGHGMQFSEHRVYTAGDDVRRIDWKASARTREPLIKKYEEERELNVLLLVDLSGSGVFGSSTKLKSEIVAEVAAMLSYAAIHTGDKVGALLFAGEVEQVIPPQKGRSHVLRIVRDLLAFKPKTHGTDLAAALDSAHRVLKHSGVVFILSDFLAEGYEKSLKRLARRHDVVALRISDDREMNVPPSGLLLLLDPESGQERYVDTSSYAFQKWMADFKKGHEERTQRALQTSKVEVLPLRTHEDYGETVVRFFRARNRKKK